MLYVKVSATSANLCVGFDVLGVALNLCNVFCFEESEYFDFSSFDLKYQKKEENLVYRAYKMAFEKLNKEPIPVRVVITASIPISRGLGSSSSLIVAGLAAANYFLDQRLSQEDLLQLATELEGHPDNVAPAIFGGLVASYEINGLYRSIRYPVNPDLKWIVAIPSYEVSTEQARQLLPTTIHYSDAVKNMSCLIHIPKALMDGNIDLLKELFQDRLHEPYRKALIKDYDKINSACQNTASVSTISGSGSTMLIITKDLNILHQLENINCEFRVLEIGEGVSVWTE